MENLQPSLPHLRKIVSQSLLKKIQNKILGFIERFFSAKIRILPLVIFCASLMFTIKITHFFQKIETSDTSFSSLIELRTVIAADEAMDKKGPAPESPSLALNEKESKTEVHESNHLTRIDPLKMTAEEFKTLQELSQNEKKSGIKEQHLPEEEAAAKAIESQIEKKVQALNEAQKKLQDLLGKAEEKENVNTSRLVKMAENMKPKEAAKILEGVEFEVLIQIMEKIKEAKASAILSNMDPQKASYLITELATRKQIFKKKAEGTGEN